MRIAIPVTDGKLSAHFGHCEKFAVLDVDAGDRRILADSEVAAPPHEPGLLPAWLAEKGVTLVIAGGMGGRARALFEERRIRVIVGAPAEDPRAIVESFLNETLDPGRNFCDH